MKYSKSDSEQMRELIEAITNAMNRRDKLNLSENRERLSRRGIDDSPYRNVVRKHRINLNEQTETTMKHQIIKLIKELDDSDSEIINQIYSLLNRTKTRAELKKGFQVTLEDEHLSDKAKQEHIDDIITIINSLHLHPNEVATFSRKLQKGGVVDVNELTKTYNDLNNVFDNDEISYMVFDSLKVYGVGHKQKGPCEYAFAFLSNKIRLAETTGDLEIKGIGEVELKAAQNVNGGRLGHSGPSQERQLRTLEKYKDKIPKIYEKVMTSRGKSISLVPFIRMLNEDLPPTTSETKGIRRSLMVDLLTPVFGKSYADNIANSFTQPDVGEIVKSYVHNNFEWYKDKSGFDALLTISLARKKTAFIRTGNDIIKLFDENMLTGFRVSVIPSAAGMREYYAQLSFTAI